MSLRDCELDVATLLEAAELGSTTSAPPTLYAGPFPPTAPDEMIACLFAGGDSSEHVDGKRRSLFEPEVTVLVRGARETYNATRAKALQSFAALRNPAQAEYLEILSQGAGPAFLGRDDMGRPRFSFTVRMRYGTADTPGVVVPLDNAGALDVDGLVVQGDASVGGVLQVDARAYTDFPAAADYPGGVLFDAAGNVLRVSNGTDWVAPGGTAAEDLAEHVAAPCAHGATGAVVGTTNTQTLSNKSHQGQFSILVDANETGLSLPVLGVVDLGGVTMRGGGGYLRVGGTVYTLGAGQFGHVYAPDGYPARVTGLEADSATAVGLEVNAGQPFSNPAAKVLRVLNGGAERLSMDRDGRLSFSLFTDSSGSPGDATINAPTGRVTIPAGASSVTVTNRCVGASTMVLPVLESQDATLTVLLAPAKAAGPAYGAFTLTGNAAATSPVTVSFLLIN